MTTMTLPPKFTGYAGAPQTLQDVPEINAVQEFAFYRGQQDRDTGRSNVPVPFSPFAPSSLLNQTWADWYLKGRSSLTPARETPKTVAPSPSVENYKWAPLINVQTQTPENATGFVDVEHVYGTCKSAVDAMEALVVRIVKKGKGWEKLLVDVPRPIAEVLACGHLQLGGLWTRYLWLKNDAAVMAKAGQNPFAPL